MLPPERKSVAISKVASLILAVTLVAAGVIGVAVYYKGASGEANVLSTLKSNGDFSTLVNALSEAGLSGTLSGSAPHTLFAPTNEAFASLPSGVLPTLLGNLTRLASVLEYHIVAGTINSTNIFELTSLVTLQGSSLPIGETNTGMEVGGNASLTAGEIPCTNGIIYPIGTVLIPPSPVNATPGVMTIFQTAEFLGLDYLVQGLETANLANTLSLPGDYTLFAPTNPAMTAFSCGNPFNNCLADLMNLFSNQTAVTFVMRDNIASGNFTSAQLVNAGYVTTLAGQTLPVTSSSGVVRVGAADMTREDIRCSNGYIDIVDLLLVPPGVDQ